MGIDVLVVSVICYCPEKMSDTTFVDERSRYYRNQERTNCAPIEQPHHVLLKDLNFLQFWRETCKIICFVQNRLHMMG